MISWDKVWTGYKNTPAPYATGDFNWPIPYQYKLGTTGTVHQVTISNEHFTSNSSGKAVIEKCGSPQYSRVPGDPNSLASPTYDGGW
jgi:hypothetical protein